MRDVCYSFKDISIVCLTVEGNCPYKYSAGNELRLNEILPPGMNICLFHTIYPYYLTLSKGGRFPWAKEKGTVIAQCPKPYSGVVAKIQATDGEKDGIRVKIIERNESCLSLEEEYIINAHSITCCPQIINEIFQFLSTWNNTPADEIIMGCGGCYPDRVIFKIKGE